jgi:conjugative transfer region lipoprotein (TIGR03751 family)
MEKVYDSMSKQKNTEKNNNDINTDGGFYEQQNLKNFRQNQNKIHSVFFNNQGLKEFHKLPNPELHLYIYPHLAGIDQIPVPGYMTVFNVYERDHYALTNS